MVMGCHGIGVSKIIPVIAESYSDDNGLCWPLLVAPDDVVLVHGCVKENEAVPPKEAIDAVYGRREYVLIRFIPAAICHSGHCRSSLLGFGCRCGT